MSQPAKARDPSMEEILASIRRIITDDVAAKTPSPLSSAPTPPATDAAKPVGMPATPSAPPSPPPARPATPAASGAARPGALSGTNPQADIDALLAAFDGTSAPGSASPPSASSFRGPPGAPREARPPRPADDLLDPGEEMPPSSPPPSFRKVVARPGRPDTVLNAASGDAADPAYDSSRQRRLFNQAAAGPGRTGAPSVDERRGEQPRLLSSSTQAAVDAAFDSLAQTMLLQNTRTLEDVVRELLRPMLKAWLDDNLPHLVERLVRAEIERVSRGRG